MRKTIVTALIALLVALALASCGDIINGQNEDGLVTLSINTGEIRGSSRSIDDALAKAESQYIEVIFKHTTTGPGGTTSYYRAEGYRNRTLKVSIPKGVYTTGNADNDAIVLIGNQSDGTLLAIGTLTTSPLTVDSNTIEVKFTATSILVDIAAKGDGSSDFKITDVGDTPKGFVLADTDDGTYTYTINATNTTLDCFRVPSGSTGIKATLTFGGSFPGSGANIKVLDGSTLTPEVTPITFTHIKGPAITVLPSAVTPSVGGTFAAITGANPVPAGTIGLTFDTGAKGIYFVTFKIPVVGFTAYIPPTGPGPTPSPNPGLEHQLKWFVRAGTDAGSDFAQQANDSLVLLVTDNTDMTDVDIINSY